ncbi:MAG: hypothetical protein PF904_01375 [Kiritimatiellae bacterium]|jgi:fibronectin-binding autotransporter adhesin|nr:hypothetical protein [Kiritimatiellia bacterium]
MKRSSYVVGIIFLSTLIASATDATWSGNVSIDWSNPANWIENQVPSVNDIAVFSSLSYNNAPTLESNTVSTVSGLRFGDGSTASPAININGTLTASADQKTTSDVLTGSTVIPITDAAGLVIGELVTGTRIQAGTYIDAINGNDITLSKPTSGGTLSSGTQLTFASVLQIGSGGVAVYTGIVGEQKFVAPIVLTSNQSWTNGSTISYSLTQGGVGSIGNYTLTLNGIAGSYTRFPYSNALCGEGALIIDTAGRVDFGTGSGGRPYNPFSGGVTLNSGLIQLNGGNSGGGGSAGALGTGILTINGGNINGGGNIAGHPLTISGQIWNVDWTYLGSKNLDMGTGGISLGNTIGTNRTITALSWPTLTLGGAISNGTTVTGLTKEGSGKIALNAVNLYTGSTLINGGTVVIGASGSIAESSMVYVESGAVLDVSAVASGFTVVGDQLLKGPGSVVGNVNVSTDGIVAPGNEIGTLTVTGDMQFDNGSRLYIDVTGASADLLAVSGGVTGTGVVQVDVTADNPELPILIMTATNIVPKFSVASSEFWLIKENNNTELWLSNQPGTCIIIQ